MILGIFFTTKEKESISNQYNKSKRTFNNILAKVSDALSDFDNDYIPTKTQGKLLKEIIDFKQFNLIFTYLNKSNVETVKDVIMNGFTNRISYCNKNKIWDIQREMLKTIYIEQLALKDKRKLLKLYEEQEFADEKFDELLIERKEREKNNQKENFIKSIDTVINFIKWFCDDEYFTINFINNNKFSDMLENFLKKNQPDLKYISIFYSFSAEIFSVFSARYYTSDNNEVLLKMKKYKIKDLKKIKERVNQILK